MKISGEFEVNISPLDLSMGNDVTSKLARLKIEKTYKGELSANSNGEMLSAMTETPDSAGYVALEHVNGQLEGKQGTFVLIHFGTRRSGSEYLKLEVVPNSGTGDLKGLSGTMDIKIDNGKHFYEFEFQL